MRAIVYILQNYFHTANEPMTHHQHTLMPEENQADNSEIPAGISLYMHQGRRTGSKSGGGWG
jgi:hypothetical protein